MNTVDIAKSLRIDHNVSFRVIDKGTQQVVQEVTGHNQATNSMLLGIAHYLAGDGVFNQASDMLSSYVPRYISLGTMGLRTQNATDEGLPADLGVSAQQPGESDEDYEIRTFNEYMHQTPGYGADGYDAYDNNDRAAFGLGPTYAEKVEATGNTSPVKCELISATFPRAMISYREIVPETLTEYPNTMDIVYSAMVSTGALAQFRDGNDYIFITEAGLWSKPNYLNTQENGLLAGFRIVPPNQINWDMTIAGNREILRQNILRVGINQVVQVIWKVQIGSRTAFQ